MATRWMFERTTVDGMAGGISIAAAFAAILAAVFAATARGASLAVGDLNGDGKLDVVVTKASPSVVVVLLGACE